MWNGLPRKAMGACAVLLILSLVWMAPPAFAQDAGLPALDDMAPPPGPPADVVPEQPVADEAVNADSEPTPPPAADAAVEQPTDDSLAAPDTEVAPEASNCVDRTKDVGSDRATYVDSKSGVVGGTLKIGALSTGRQTWTLLHFNPAASIPTNSQITGATLKLNQTGAEAASGNITIAAHRSKGNWSPGISFGAAQGLVGTQFAGTGVIGTNPGTVSMDAKGVTAEWLQQGAGNFGAIFTSSQGGIHNFSTSAKLSIKYRCDKQAPAAVMQNFSHPYHNAVFGVSWRGSDPDTANCGASGIDKFTVEYSTNNSTWNAYATSSGKSCTSSSQERNQDFNNATYKLAEGTTVYFRVTSKDYAGNKQSSHSSSIHTILDFTPPEVKFTELPRYTIGASFDVIWTATDKISGVEGCVLSQQIDGGSWTQASNVVRNGDQFKYTVTGAQNLKKYGFKAVCTDNAKNADPDPGAAQVSTTVSTYPMAVMNNITPNLVHSTSPNATELTLAWEGVTSPSMPIDGYRIYYRHTVGTAQGAWIQWKDVGANDRNQKFPFATIDPAKPNGLWDFQVLTHSSQGYAPLQSKGVQASAVTDLDDKGQNSFMPLTEKR